MDTLKIHEGSCFAQRPSDGCSEEVDTSHLANAKMRSTMPRRSDPKTPLLELLRLLETDKKREELAKLAGTTTAYLYQLASCNRGACRSRLAKGIADASVRMHKKYGTPIVTMEILACMCPAVGAK